MTAHRRNQRVPGQAASPASSTVTGTILVRRGGVGIVVALALAALGGCGGTANSLSENSTCEDFLAADGESQRSLVQQLAGKYDKPDYSTPLGMPAVPYYCSGHPDVTLKQFFAFAGG